MADVASEPEPEPEDPNAGETASHEIDPAASETVTYGVDPDAQTNDESVDELTAGAFAAVAAASVTRERKPEARGDGDDGAAAGGGGGGSDLSDGLLHQPRPDDDRPRDRWAYRPLVMLLVTLAVAYHGLVLLVHNLPGKGLAKEVHTFFNEKLQAGNYMRATGNSQSWAMFAPNPHRSNMFMKVLVKDEDGEIWDIKHDMYGKRSYPYLFYSREGKINRRLIEEKGYRRHFAAWVCREWEMTHDGASPEEVQFIKMWTTVPPPEKVFFRRVDSDGDGSKDSLYIGYDPMQLHLNQREEDTIRCSTSYHGQVPEEIRERLDLPPTNSGRFRDVHVRTWWDNLKAKEKQAERDAAKAENDDDDASAPEPVGEVEGEGNQMIGLLALLEDKPEVDVSAHLGQATTLLFAIILLLIGFFLVRPELWRRLFFTRIDPRPAALMRIVFGFVVLWTFADLTRDAKFLFTDEGMWLTKMARKNYGGKLTQMWDPEHGFEHWYDIFVVLWGKFTIFHLRSDPRVVYSMYGLMLASLTAMIFGVWTRFTTILSWFLVEQVYRYSPLFYTGGDTVVRVFMYLGMFCRWGEAYSFDNWWRTRRAILRGGATAIPPLRRIPAWPQRLMMLQLAIIYCATGLLKSGVTWINGTALYYSLCLDHFYRMKEQIQVATFMQWIGILPVVTVVVRFWEAMFPLVLIGVAVNAYERERQAGLWPHAAVWRRALSYLMCASAVVCAAVIAGWSAYYYIPDQHVTFMAKEALIPIVTAAALAIVLVLLGIYFGLRRWSRRGFFVLTHWVLGRRFWLVWGFMMHIGIDIGMNVGTFAEVMMAAYFAWPTGDEVDRAWRYLMSRPAAPGQGGRPVRKRKPIRWLLAASDRLSYRLPGKLYTVHHNPDEQSVRHAALLRAWDLGYRLEFVADRSVASRRLVVSIEGEKVRHVGAHAGRALLAILPGLWWLWPLRHIPVLGAAAGALAVVMLRQRP